MKHGGGSTIMQASDAELIVLVLKADYDDILRKNVKSAAGLV